MPQFNHTQYTALLYLNERMKKFLEAFRLGKLEHDFFIKGMFSMVSEVELIARENGKGWNVDEYLQKERP